LIALLSLIPDLIPFETLDEALPPDSSTFDVVLAAFRVLRLFRLWRIFRVLRLMDIYGTDSYTYANRLGKQLSTHISMKVGCIVIIVACAIAMIQYDSPFYGTEMAIEMLESLPLYGAAFNETLLTITESFPIMYIRMYNKTVFTTGESILDPRGIEIEEFQTTYTYCVMNINEQVKGESTLTILLVTAVLVFYFIIALIVQVDVKKKVVRPMKGVCEKILQLGSAIGVFKTKNLEEMYKNPHSFFFRLLEKIGKRYD